ncbi:hypothetical protein CTAYLR_006256 [Chrysophaeum taylorii]|uniref:Calponin-homology (CH) domain-containing protein n=1 Tax=Chrysophaeum taylorii TaxID=2483200 RepID=A0AAD7XNU7_9STRA|nr:hypothetical protein CTAYLR_006256 [Chrysophaeum taylorii]
MGLYERDWSGRKPPQLRRSDSASWLKRQERLYCMWINGVLRGRHVPKVENLRRDLVNGVVLFNLIEVLSRGSLKKRVTDVVFDTRPTKIHQLEKLSVLFSALEELGVSLVNISPSDVHDGNLTCIFGLIWTLMTSLGRPPASYAAIKDELYAWVLARAGRVLGISKLSELQPKFRDGSAFLALVAVDGLARFGEDHPPLDTALRAAERSFGVPPLVRDPSDEQAAVAWLLEYRRARRPRASKIILTLRRVKGAVGNDPLYCCATTPRSTSGRTRPATPLRGEVGWDEDVVVETGDANSDIVIHLVRSKIGWFGGTDDEPYGRCVIHESSILARRDGNARIAVLPPLVPNDALLCRCTAIDPSLLVISTDLPQPLGELDLGFFALDALASVSSDIPEALTTEIAFDEVPPASALADDDGDYDIAFDELVPVTARETYDFYAIPAKKKTTTTTKLSPPFDDDDDDDDGTKLAGVPPPAFDIPVTYEVGIRKKSTSPPQIVETPPPPPPPPRRKRSRTSFLHELIRIADV